MKNDLADTLASIFVALIVSIALLGIPPLFIWMGWQRVFVEAFKFPSLSYLQCFWLNIGVKALCGRIQIKTTQKGNDNDNA